MKKLIFLIVTLCLLAPGASAQYLPVTTPTACITDGSGAALASGQMIVVGTDANDNPIPYRAGTSIMSTTAPITRTITAGQLATSLQLADPASTSPTGVLYRFAIKDNGTSKITLYKQIVIANNDSGNFNFCKMNPLPFTTQVQFAAAPFSFSGDWVLSGNLSVTKSTQLCESTVTFSATPTFNAGICNGWKITLTGNVTSSTLSGALIGEPLYFEVCQDATGGRSFVPPSNVLSWKAISTAINTCTLQIYWYDGTNALPDVMPGLTGDVNSSAGFVVTTVVKVNGVSYSSGPSTHSVPIVTASNVVTYKVIPDCTDVNGNHLNYTQSTDVWSCGTSIPTITGRIIQASCTGTATSSTTLGLSFIACTSVAGLKIPFGSSGTIGQLECIANTGGSNASSGAVTVLKNGVAQTLVCTIGTGTACNDLTHSFSVVAGDSINLNFTTQAAETLASLSCTVEKR